MTTASERALQLLEQASQDPRLTDDAVKNIRMWLTEPRYAEYVDQILQHLEAGKIQELDDAFWTVIPFGTGGRRGRMYPIGCNAINDRTIGESAQGLATYVREALGGEGLSCAIAYDTRHRSRHFAELCAGIMVANGFRVYFLDDYRSTPELSFLVRHRQCSCGIMVTASHNPPSDNAVKVYWSTGAQVQPPHDAAIIQKVGETQQIETASFAQAVSDGQVVLCTEDTDEAYHAAVVAERLGNSRGAKVIYSPLHGVGEHSVMACLAADGFSDIEVYERHRERSGDFPNVPDHVSNPENPAVFDEIIRHAQDVDADLVLATDPDCDRMGAAAPLTTDPSGLWSTFNGNQLGVLLCDYVLSQRAAAGTLTPDHYVVSTLVTTQMLRRVAESYGVKAYMDQLVGFKWICGRMDEEGADRFCFGTEESHGYLVGQYARDKDGAVACMLMAELASACKAAGISVHDRLAQLHRRHGYHAERLLNVRMEGSEGMAEMRKLMDQFRNDPPRAIGGIAVTSVRDYGAGETLDVASGRREPLDGPRGTLIIMDLAEPGNYVAVRPSGTEPKVKYYMFAYAPPTADMYSSIDAVQHRLDAIEQDLK
ncbi:MAG: phospho-sugar mutase [Planctomycetales bacterium]|nr:phospho-sugar mutase [Planctomycetales bacterium]